MNNSHTNLLDIDVNKLQEELMALGEPRYRAAQIWHAIYQTKVNDIQDVTNLPKSLRINLQNKFTLGNLSLLNELRSSDNSTIKVLFRLCDGKIIETVLMNYNKRSTVCISTQAGCALGCVFCATGQMGFERHLSVGEIVEQVLWSYRKLNDINRTLTNIVFMGMGEPFHNYENSIKALDRIEDINSIGMSARRITVSTAGHAEAIEKFARSGRKERLAVSLHASTDKLRTQLMPINKRYPLEVLMNACHLYYSITKRRITFEWAMIDGVNDTEEQSQKLCKLLNNIDCHVNVIPLNPTDNYNGSHSTRDLIKQFKSQLESSGIPCTIRLRRGIDIQAGCGQLKSKHMR